MKQNTGKLITFEGGEGAGKTLQIKRLRDRMTAAKYDVVVLREPGGTVISEQIREVLLNPKNIGMAYTTEVLLFQAARAQIYREIVVPSLTAGKVVLMDRSRDSSVVYQGMVRGFGMTLINQLNDISTKDTYPDITVLLDVDVMTGLDRRSREGKMDRLDMEGEDFHQQVRKGFLQLAQLDTRDRFVVIDANKGIDEVADAVWKAVSERLSA